MQGQTVSARNMGFVKGGGNHNFYVEDSLRVEMYVSDTFTLGALINGETNEITLCEIMRIIL